MLIEKEVIAPGTYWYLDQKTSVPHKWVVTPETTKHLQEQGNKMVALGLPIPIPFEHDFQAHPMTPAEQLKSNAGQVKEYRIRDAKDPVTKEMRKDVLFSICDIQDPDAVKKIPKSIRWTSPWVTSFVDGDGRAWNNVIAHLALTARPRVTKQSPFPSIAAAMAFALTTPNDVIDLTKPGPEKGFVVSKAARLIEKNKKFEPEYPMAFSMLAGGIALADDPASDIGKGKKEKTKPKEEGGGGDTPPPKKKSKEEGGSNGPPDDDGDEGGENGGGEVDVPEGMSEFSDKAGDVAMEEVLADLLGALGIHLEGTVGETQFKRALYNAAMTKIHELTGKAQGDPMADTTTQPPPGQGAGGAPPNPLIKQEQPPMYMSLDDINKIPDQLTKGVMLSMYNDNVKLRNEADADRKTTASLRDAKLKDENAKRTSRINLIGKMSPRVKADLDAMLALPSMALSMGDGGTVVDPMAQTLMVLEKGLADMPRLLTTPSDQVIAMAQPTDADALTEQRADEIADSLARQMGCPPVQKKAG